MKSVQSVPRTKPRKIQQQIFFHKPTICHRKTHQARSQGFCPGKSKKLRSFWLSAWLHLGISWLPCSSLPSDLAISFTSETTMAVAAWSSTSFKPETDPRNPSMTIMAPLQRQFHMKTLPQKKWLSSWPPFLQEQPEQQFTDLESYNSLRNISHGEVAFSHTHSDTIFHITCSALAWWTGSRHITMYYTLFEYNSTKNPQTYSALSRFEISEILCGLCLWLDWPVSWWNNPLEKASWKYIHDINHLSLL